MTNTGDQLRSDRQEGTAPPVERTGEAVEIKPEKLKNLRAVMQNVDRARGDIQKGSAFALALMSEAGKLQAENAAEQQRLEALSREERERIAKADDIAREGTMRALASLEEGDQDRLDGAVDFLVRWPKDGKALETAGLREGELTVIALRLAKENPKAFADVAWDTDFGLSKEDRIVIAEAFRDESSDAFPELVKALRIGTEKVRELVSTATPELRKKTYEALHIPEAGPDLSEKQMVDMERGELKDATIGRAETIETALADALAESFPERASRLRERAGEELELKKGIVAVRDLGSNTAGAPMVVRFEGREHPAVHKAERREIEKKKEQLKKAKAFLKSDDFKELDPERREKIRQEIAAQEQSDMRDRPGIDTETVPTREWLGYQVDKALGFDVVPTTVLRSGPEGRGSVQDWRIGEPLKETPDWLRKVRSDEKFRLEMAKVALFDLLVENADRHTGNIQVSPDGKLAAIDNGLISPKPETPIDHVRSFPLWALEGQEIPKPLLEAAEAILNAPQVLEQLKAGFSLALKKDGARGFDAFVKRLKQVSVMKRFPTTVALAAEGNRWHEFDRKHRDRFAAEVDNNA